VIATLLLVVATSGWVNSRRQASRRAEIAQRFGQEAERIEWFLRHAQALPQHDIRREQQLMKERLQRLQLQIRQLGPLAQGPGNFALGRGYARLNQPHRAAELLQEAWGSGYRTAEVALALGKALGTVYDEKRNDALRIRDADLRAAQVRELETRYRDKALHFLSQAGSPELESSSALFGLIAFYDGRLDEALRRAREAREEAPWLVEGFRLEGDVLLAKATLEGDPGLFEQAEKTFDASLDAYAQALLLAPSDPTLYERLCNGWALRLNGQRHQPGAALDSTFDSGLESCRTALKVNPESANAWHLTSTLLLVRLQDPGLPPDEMLSLLGEADGAVRKALERAPLHAEAHHTLGTVSLTRALRIELPGGSDPREALDRAAEAFRRSLELDPGLVKSYANLGTALAVSAGQIGARGGDPSPAFNEAIASFQQALDRSPGKVLLLYNLANLLRDKAEIEAARGLDSIATWNRAVEYANETLEKSPTLAPAWNLLGALEEGLARQKIANGGDPSPHFDRALRAFDRVLEVDSKYFRAAVNQASTGILQARFEAAQGRSPEEPLDKAMAAADRARALSASTAEFVFQQLADSRLLRAEITLAQGEPAGDWLEQATRHLDEGVAVHPENAPLLIGKATVELLRVRDQVGETPAEKPCLLETRNQLADILEKNPKTGAASLVLAESQLWCGFRASSPRSRQEFFKAGLEILSEAGPSSWYQPSKEILFKALSMLASEGDQEAVGALEDAHIQRRRQLREAIGKDSLLAWRFEPLLSQGTGRGTTPASTRPAP